MKNPFYEICKPNPMLSAETVCAMEEAWDKAIEAAADLMDKIHGDRVTGDTIKGQLKSTGQRFGPPLTVSEDVR